MITRRLSPLLALLLLVGGCSEDTAVTDTGGNGDVDDAGDGDIDDGGPAALRFPDDFVFGAATAAHQIEGGNTNNNWYQFETLDQYRGQTAAPSGRAANSWELWQTDNGLVEATHLDAYRFSVEWSRIEPRRGVYDDDAIAHYRALLEDLETRGIRPFVTLHHFTEPIWLQDLRDLGCADGPSDENLCGWTNPDAVASFVAFARRMAEEYGDLVDEWSTFNEPNTYSHIGYVLRTFPPGAPGTGPGLPDDSVWLSGAAPVIKALIEAHVGAYEAIKEADTVDADADGSAAVVGWTIATQYAVPTHPDRAADVAAADAYRVFLNYIYPDAVARGAWDLDLDGVPDEQHPEWRGRQDFIGIQYYTRTFVLDSPTEDRILSFVPCQDVIARLFNQCPDIDPLDVSFINEVYPEGLFEVLSEFAERYPGVPLPVTENGGAADNGERKAQIIVRHLEQVHRAVEAGLPVTGWYVWSLVDNFEWAHGFGPRFGIYEVDFDTFERIPTRAQEVVAEVAATGVLSSGLRATYATGPLFADD